jgi:ADP-heptose:LPS heptosyltransferase
MNGGARMDGVRKIAVLRPSAVGDFVFALPALHALRQAYPAADIAYIGKAWHAGFLAQRPMPVDRVLQIPPVPGVGAPPDAPCAPLPVQRFLAAMREEQFDIALQIFGGGRYSNAFIRQCGARLAVGACTPEALRLDRWIAYGDFSNRRLELLDIVALAGAPPVPVPCELAVTARDRGEAAAVLAPAPGERLVVLHPGASDARRRWPAVRFAAVADLLAARGALVAVNGTADEAPLVREVSAHMRHGAVDLSGRLSLGALCGLLERAALVLSNDSGPLHLALALRRPCVGVYWLTNLMEACPMHQHAHRPALSVRVHCPVCGQENRKTRCAHDVCFVDDVREDEVAALALELFSSPSMQQ